MLDDPCCCFLRLCRFFWPRLPPPSSSSLSNPSPPPPLLAADPVDFCFPVAPPGGESTHTCSVSSSAAAGRAEMSSDAITRYVDRSPFRALRSFCACRRAWADSTRFCQFPRTICVVLVVQYVVFSVPSPLYAIRLRRVADQ